jgi:hypothetical protein
VQAWSRKNTLSGLKFRTELDAHEAGVLRTLVNSVVAMLDERESQAPHDELEEITGVRTGNSARPDNPTMARLLPDFHRGGPAGEAPGVSGRLSKAQAEDLNSALRSLHEPEIIDAKRGAAALLLHMVPAAGGKISLTAEQADSWLNAVNDVRLALGTMLDIKTGSDDEIDPEDPRAGHLGVYHWLTWMQDSLLQAVLGER